MTEEEIIEYANLSMQSVELDNDENTVAYDFYKSVIKALQTEHCGDVVSLADVFEIMGNLLSIPYDFDRRITEHDVSKAMDDIRELKRVQCQTAYCGRREPQADFCDFSAPTVRPFLKLHDVSGRAAHSPRFYFSRGTSSFEIRLRDTRSLVH